MSTQMDTAPAAMAARRIPLERPLTQADERKLLRLQDDMKKRIGANINRLRVDAGLSLRQLGMRANLSPTYISEVERAQRALSIDVLIRLGYALGSTAVELLSEKN